MIREEDSIILGKENIKSVNNEDNQDDYIKLSDQARLSNLMVISTKNSGKTRYLIPAMIKQDLENKEAGMTIIVGRSEIAYELYALAIMAKRKPILLKPSTNFAVLNQLLYAKSWDYQMINDDIINYKDAIRLKKIVIIDMETEYYSMHSIKAVDMLLMQLQSDMMDTDVTGRRRHYVYIDEAYRYLDFLNNLLEYGDDYNVSTTLFFQSRSQFINENKDYSTLINNNVRNTILMQGITYEDALYYSRFMFERNEVQTLLNRSFGQFTYSLLREGTNSRNIGTGQLLLLDQEEQDIIHKKALSCRRKLLKELKQKVIGKRMQLFQEREALETLNSRLDKDGDESYLDSIEEDIMENALPSFEDIDASYALSGGLVEEESAAAYDDSALLQELTSNNNLDISSIESDVNDQAQTDMCKQANAEDQNNVSQLSSPVNHTEVKEDDIIDNETTDIQSEANFDLDDELLDSEGFIPDATDLPELNDDINISFDESLNNIQIDNLLASDTNIPDPNDIVGDINNVDIMNDVDLSEDEISQINIETVPQNEKLSSESDNIGSEENEKFNIDHCEFIIGGQIETNLSKGAISSKPIRVKMPYKEMRNSAMNKQFENFFN